MFIQIDPEKPLLKDIKNIASILKNGGIIAYPTDTIYGIGCDLLNKSSIEKIYQIKKMPAYKPLSFICSDIKEVSIYAHLSNTAFKLMKQLTPGPYTFIFEATKVVPKIMLTKRRTVGIRIADNKICTELIKELGNPIISTSASVHKNEILSDPFEIHEKFGKNLDAVIDAGCLISEPSTVIDLTGTSPEVIREGKGSINF